MSQCNTTVLDRIIVSVMWLLWGASVVVGVLISIEDMHYLQVPQQAMHHSQKEVDVHIDEITKEVTVKSKNRSLYPYEEFELFMSLGRTPKRTTESFWAIVVFVLTSQFLILWKLKQPSRRWIMFIILLVVGTLWTWYQITHWLQWMCITFMGKILGDPFGLLALPTIFFCCVASNRSWTNTAEKILRFTAVQVLLFYPWFYIWSYTELVLGWIWI